LSNDAAAQILAALDRTRLTHVVAAHLSQQNNLPELAQAALASVLGAAASDIMVASQALGFDWLGCAGD
jgi:phosphoribosyl 1,2-cyclic phosphodiesterase